jgi:DUF1009 family protein
LSAAGAYETAPQSGDSDAPLAIICGGGAFPGAVAEAVLRRGRGVHLFLVRGFADPALARYPHDWVKLGSFATLVSVTRRKQIKELVFIGSLIRPRLLQMGLDWRTLLLLPRLTRIFLGGDNRLLSGMTKILAEHGYVLRGAHEVAPEILIPEGMMTARQPSDEERADISVGKDLLHAIDRFDVGQAAVIAGRRIIAIEGPEGTAGMLARIAEMRKSGRLRLKEREGVLVKIPKPSQERRIDLPAIGEETLEQAKAAGLSGIAIEALGTIVIDAQKFLQAAEAAGLFVMALPPAEREQA